MDLKLELVVIPVTDVDRAKSFYVENAGFNLDVDQSFGDDFRVVQMSRRARRAQSASARGSRKRPRAQSKAFS